MLYALICTDKPNALAVRMEARSRHLAYIEQHLAQVKIAGPFMSDDGATMAGSLIVIEADDLAAARDFSAKDPYALAGLFQSVEIKPWRWTIGAPKG
ncbi:MAG: YciI family protein [Alphaproteobacteria bacterium]|nr:YciI family protein [Alphaproteobacteria bacterium]